MKVAKNRWLVLRRKKPAISIVLIGLPQFSITLEHRYADGYWETALSLFVVGIFINWGVKL